MTRLFLRLFLAVVVTLLLTNWSLDYIFEHFVEDPMDKNRMALEQSLKMFALGFVEKSENLDSDLDLLQRKFKAPATIESLSHWALPKEDQTRLNHGEMLDMETENGHLMIMKLNDASDRVLVLGPFHYLNQTKHFEYVFLVIFYAILAFVLLLWVWPHWRHLEKINTASLEFGQGNLESRVKLPEHSAVHVVAVTFNSMAERIQTLIQSHKHLTSAVAHELRTPLSRIQFSLEMLQNAKGDDLIRHIDYMQQDINELDKLIAEMMTYARLERGTPPMKIQNIEIIPWIYSVIDRLKTEHTSITIGFRFDENHENINVRCYAHYLERAILNLMNNALRFAKNNIVIEFKCDEKICFIFVDDDGPGIPIDKREDVLKPFMRLEEKSKSGKETNFGLGLSIVEQIAKWHDGQIHIESSPLQGARFIFSWPCQANFPQNELQASVDKPINNAISNS